MGMNRITKLIIENEGPLKYKQLLTLKDEILETINDDSVAIKKVWRNLHKAREIDCTYQYFYRSVKKWMDEPKKEKTNINTQKTFVSDTVKSNSNETKEISSNVAQTLSNIRASKPKRERITGKNWTGKPLSKMELYGEPDD